MASKLEETEKRRQDIVSKRDAEIEAKKGHALSRHEEAQRRREVQMRTRREKLLNDVEKSDRLSREAKRRNRHSWGGNINEVFGTDMLDTGGEELPDRPRPTALPKTMQNWISGLRSYCDDTDPESANSSTLTTSSPRDKTFNVPERLLTPTAASKAKFNRTTPDGNADDSHVPNERGDFDGKLKRRTVSSLDLDRLSRPKKTVSRGSSANRGFPDGGFGKLTRASSVTHLATPSPKHPVRQTRTRSRDDARSSMPARPTPEGREVIKRTKETPKPRPASAVGLSRTNPQTKNKKPAEQPKPKATPKLKTEPIANSTPKINTNKTKPKSQTKSSDKKSNTLKQQMDLEDLEDDTPNIELKIEEPNEDNNEESESAEANISSETITLDKPSTPSLIDISQESPQDQPIIEISESSVPESSIERTDSPSKENIQEQIEKSAEVEKSDEPIVENGADDTIRSDAGLEGRSSPSERKSVTWNDENIQRVESIEITPNQNEDHEEGSTSKDKKKKKKKDKEDKKDKKDKKKKKDKKPKENHFDAVSAWLGQSNNSQSESENPSLAQTDEVPPSEAASEVTSAPSVATTNNNTTNDEDEYKRRIAEQKRLHQLKKQQEEEERLKAVQEAEAREAERKEQEKKAKLEALDAKVEEEKRKLAEKMDINIKKSLEEKEQKRKEEEDQRKARKERIAAIMRRTRETNNEENDAQQQPSGELSERLMQRTTSNESGTSSNVTDITSRVGSLLGSLRNNEGLNLHRTSSNQSSQENSVNQAVPSVQ